eukprot:COSAG01_NODE_2223_length_8136_cov_10.727917_6_plen_158_part_00
MEEGAEVTGPVLEAAHWAEYHELGAEGLRGAYRRVARLAVERYNQQCGGTGAEPRAGLGSGDGSDSSARATAAAPAALSPPPALELEEEAQLRCWPALERRLPRDLPLPCAYYDAQFLPRADADRLLRAALGLRWGIGGQAAKRYTAVPPSAEPRRC